jgi:hypothetical protein
MERLGPPADKDERLGSRHSLGVLDLNAQRVYRVSNVPKGQLQIRIRTLIFDYAV